MCKKFFFIGLLILSLVMLVEPSSASEPVFVHVGDGGGNCINYDFPYIGFTDCNTTLTGGYGTLAVTHSEFGHENNVEWDTDEMDRSGHGRTIPVRNRC